MDIGWAVKAMKNGVLVRRAIWPGLTEEVEIPTWNHLFYQDAPGYTPGIMAVRSDGLISPFVMTDPYLLADDWELA